MATTWNPADKNAGITLSNGELTAATGSGGIAVRSVASSGGKFYFETLYDAGNSSGPNGGVANAAMPLNDDLGNNANSIVAWGDGQVYNPADLGPWAPGAITAGDIGSHACDAAAKLYWARLNGGDWNNDPTADPATGTGGYSITNAGPYFAACSPMGQLTAAFAAGSWTYAAPAGFGELGAAAGVTAAASITEAGDAASSAGRGKIQAAFARTEAGDTLTASGAVATAITADASMTEAGDSLSAAGAGPAAAITAAVAVTEGDDTLSCTAAIFGWLPVPPADETWTPIPANDETWTPIAAAATSWS